MDKLDFITFQNNKITIADLVAQLSALAVSHKLRHGVHGVAAVYTLYADYPYNTRVIVMVKLNTPTGLSVMELKSLETLGEFLSNVEII